MAGVRLKPANARTRGATFRRELAQGMNYYAAVPPRTALEKSDSRDGPKATVAALAVLGLAHGLLLPDAKDAGDVDGPHSGHAMP